MKTLFIFCLSTQRVAVGYAGTDDDQPEISTYLRLQLGNGGNWAFSSLRTEWQGSAKSGEYLTFRFGVHYQAKHITFLCYETSRLNIDRKDFSVSNVDARWFITQLGINQRYLFNQRTIRPYGEMGLSLAKADLETDPVITDIATTGRTTLCASLGTGIELIFEKATVFEIGGRVSYFNDHQSYPDLNFTYAILYVGFGFSFK